MPARRANRVSFPVRLDRSTKNYGVYVADEAAEGAELLGKFYVPRNGEEPPEFGTLVFTPRDS